MSWSLSSTGTPEVVAADIERESNRLTGQSKIEFDDAKPHMIALVKQNFRPQDDTLAQFVNFYACGSGSARNGEAEGSVEQVQRQIKVTIEPIFVRTK